MMRGARQMSDKLMRETCTKITSPQEPKNIITHIKDLVNSACLLINGYDNNYTTFLYFLINFALFRETLEQEGSSAHLSSKSLFTASSVKSSIEFNGK